MLPVNVYTDYMDDCALVCSAQGLVNDETQRPILLGLREFPLLGITRTLIQALLFIAMLADGITKADRTNGLPKYCTSDRVTYGSMNEKYFRVSIFARRTTLMTRTSNVTYRI